MFPTGGPARQQLEAVPESELYFWPLPGSAGARGIFRLWSYCVPCVWALKQLSNAPIRITVGGTPTIMSNRFSTWIILAASDEQIASPRWAVLGLLGSVLSSGGRWEAELRAVHIVFYEATFNRRTRSTTTRPPDERTPNGSPTRNIFRAHSDHPAPERVVPPARINFGPIQTILPPERVVPPTIINFGPIQSTLPPNGVLPKKANRNPKKINQKPKKPNRKQKTKETQSKSKENPATKTKEIQSKSKENQAKTKRNPSENLPPSAQLHFVSVKNHFERATKDSPRLGGRRR